MWSACSTKDSEILIYFTIFLMILPFKFLFQCARNNYIFSLCSLRFSVHSVSFFRCSFALTVCGLPRWVS